MCVCIKERERESNILYKIYILACTIRIKKVNFKLVKTLSGHLMQMLGDILHTDCMYITRFT